MKIFSFFKCSLPILVLCAIAALEFLWGLGNSSLNDWDEAIYAQVSKEMIESGNYVVPHWNYEPWFDKPPLLTWTTALFYRMFEVNEFWSRAASAFSGAALIILTYLIGRALYDKYVGFFGSLILLTSYQFVKYARLGMTDVLLTLFIFMAVYAYIRLRNGNQKWWYIIWISCSLAFMVKSVAALIAPAMIALDLLLERRFVPMVKSRNFWFGLFLAFLIVSSWHIIMYIEHGQAFISRYISHNIIARSTSTLEKHFENRFFYIDVLRHYFFPWFYLTPFAVLLSLKENFQGQSRSRILLIVIILVFGIYTIVPTKLEWYIIPLYPALAILNAWLVIAAFKSYKTAAFIALAVATVIAALIVPLYLVIIFGCIGLLAILFRLRKKEPISPLIVITVFAFFIVISINTLRPLYRGGESQAAKLGRIAGSANPNDRKSLIILESYEPELWGPTVLFYSNRPVQLAQSPKDLAYFTDDHGIKDIILTKKDMEFLSTDYEIHILEEAEPLIYANIKPKGEMK